MEPLGRFPRVLNGVPRPQAARGTFNILPRDSIESNANGGT